MNKGKLCLGTGLCFDGVPIIYQVSVIKNAGFDAIFTDWDNKNDWDKIADEIYKQGLFYHSIHAPFYGMDDIWHDEQGDLAAKITADIFDCTDKCEHYGVKLMICHAIIGMDNHTPTELGIKRIDKIIEYAAKKNITIAFENTEGEEYLKRIFEVFGECPNVGFCFDSGHEMCYNYSTDMLGKYGEYLVSTHLNDNMGMTDINEMTFLDDSHLLPFDGVANWNNIAERLHKCGFDGTLTFELNSKSKPKRTANDIYKNMSIEQYIAAAFERAKRFEAILKNT